MCPSCCCVGANGLNGAGGDGGKIAISLRSTSDIYSYNTSLVFDNSGGGGAYQAVAGKGGKPGRSITEGDDSARGGCETRAGQPPWRSHDAMPCRENLHPMVRSCLHGERT